jgi:hypothetical protein
LLDFVWIPPYAMLSFFHGIHGIVVRQAKKHPFGPDHSPNVSAAKTDCAAFFSFTMQHISDTLESYQTTNSFLYWNLDTEVRILGEHHVSSHIARLQANATTYSRNCTTVPILATKDDTGATLQNTSSCATFLGAEWRKKRHKSTLRKAVLFFAHAYLTITIGSRGRLPGHSLARLT